MSYWGFRPYVSVAERRSNAARNIVKQLGKGVPPAPIEKFSGSKLAKTFWGQAWCENLESYSDFENRLDRGKTYTRNGSIVHLEIGEGKVTAFIAGSDLYRVDVTLEALDEARWVAFKKRCGGKIATLLDLLQGKVADAVLEEITDRKTGLFPSSEEIRFECSCPDYAMMCKHVAATLYGVGVRLDSAPELFFAMRGVDHEEIIDGASVEQLDEDLPDHDSVLASGDLSDIFGIEFSNLPGTAVKKLRAARRR